MRDWYNQNFAYVIIITDHLTQNMTRYNITQICLAITNLI